MEYRFGSDEFYFLLKSAYEEGNTDQLGELLWPQVYKVSQHLFKNTLFSGYSPEDKEDAQQETMLYVLGKIEAFLLNPRNHPSAPEEIRYSPKQKEKLFFNLVEYGLLHSYRDVHREPTISLNGKDKNGRSLEETLFVPDKWMPDERLQAKEFLKEALYSFFSLSNNPETLVSIGFVILNEHIGGESMSLEEYADFFNGKSVDMVVEEIEALLMPLNLHTDVLLPLKRRLGNNVIPYQFTSITPSKLANRKNSILSKLSMKIKENRHVFKSSDTEREGKLNE